MSYVINPVTACRIGLRLVDSLLSSSKPSICYLKHKSLIGAFHAENVSLIFNMALTTQHKHFSYN